MREPRNWMGKRLAKIMRLHSGVGREGKFEILIGRKGHAGHTAMYSDFGLARAGVVFAAALKVAQMILINTPI